MGLTVYLLDKQMRMRRPIIARQIAELIHSEADGRLDAEIAIGAAPRTGEYLGFVCRDGRFRAFEIERVEQVDEEGLDIITARDAARVWMQNHVVEQAGIAGKSARAAVEAVLSGTGWTIGTVTATGTVGQVAAYFETFESAFEKIADTAKAEVIPYYTFASGQITERRVDVLTQEPAYKGRIISPKNASGIGLIEDGAPITRVYPVGRAEGTGLEQTRVTIAGASWSTAAGNPANKPAGQTWIAIPGAEADGVVRGYVYTGNGVDDPYQLMQDGYNDLLKKASPTISGTARAGDISYLAGYALNSIATGDKVGIRNRWGSVVSERVANVNWDYVRPHLSLLEFGQRVNREWITTQIQQTSTELQNVGTQLSSVRSRVGGLSATVEQNGIELYEAIEQLVTLEEETATQFNEVYIDLDATNARIDLKANSTTVNELAETVRQAGIEIDALNASVALKASQSDVDKLTGRVSTAEATLTVQAGQISSKVSKDGVISSINQTPESVVISAGKINLSGYVTVSRLNASLEEALAAKISFLQAGTLSADSVNTTYLTADSFNFANKQISRRSITVSTPSGSATIYYLGYVG